MYVLPSPTDSLDVTKASSDITPKLRAWNNSEVNGLFTFNAISKYHIYILTDRSINICPKRIAIHVDIN